MMNKFSVVVMGLFLVLGICAFSQYESVASESYGLSNSDIADYALNTYGWSCGSVVSRGRDVDTNGRELYEWAYVGPLVGVYQNITCSSGKKLRVYPRRNMHPLITNSYGGAR